jgi:hypothetical protein
MTVTGAAKYCTMHYPIFQRKKIDYKALYNFFEKQGFM